MNGTAKKHFQTLVDPLNLTIRLRMIGCAHEQLSTMEFEQLTPKRTEKNLVTITDNGRGKTMKPNHLIQN